MAKKRTWLFGQVFSFELTSARARIRRPPEEIATILDEEVGWSAYPLELSVLWGHYWNEVSIDRCVCLW